MNFKNEKDLKLAGPNSSLQTGIEFDNTNISLHQSKKKGNSQKIVLSKEQKIIFEKMENGHDNMMITGKAGSGKTELLKYFIANTEKHQIVLAPTGVAAINISGQTIHGFFHLEFGIQPLENIKKRKISCNLKDILMKTDVIIIDEISMVSPNVIDAIDIICKKARNNDLAFGGIQLICFGDLYQLPPVYKDQERDYLQKIYNGTLFFKAHAFENNNLIEDNSLKIYELNHVFRQNDEKFKKILNKIRIGRYDLEDLDILNKRVITGKIDKDVITLTARNDTANNINSYRLGKLPNVEFTYKACISGKVPVSHFPADELLRLKVGAKVMMTNNDRNGRWFNGSFGIITNLDTNQIKVMIGNQEYLIERNRWEEIKYAMVDGELSKEITGVFEQFPLKLAWAITIHKSQGQTLDSVLIDLGYGAFADGQTYVALSRCSSLDRLYLKKTIKMSDIQVNKEVVDFMETAKIIEIAEENLNKKGEDNR